MNDAKFLGTHMSYQDLILKRVYAMFSNGFFGRYFTCHLFISPFFTFPCITLPLPPCHGWVLKYYELFLYYYFVLPSKFHFLVVKKSYSLFFLGQYLNLPFFLITQPKTKTILQKKKQKCVPDMLLVFHL